jgi:cyclopropane fatty-acyl-phospholipid synthase-like methyltransferase
MNRADHSAPSFFDAKYSEVADPWNFEQDAYELARYEAIYQAIAGERYRYALEAGCSIGVLTLRLANLCDKVLAIDFSQVAVDTAACRCDAQPCIEVRCQAIEAVESFEPFDLVIVSEIGYYFSESAWRTLSHRFISEMKRGAKVLACHWLGASEDHEMGGDRVHEILEESSDLASEQCVRGSDFRLQVWTKV